MPIEIQCQNCQKKLKVADKFAGKKAKCPNCQGILEIPGAVAAAAPVAAPTAKASPSSSQVGATAPKSASKSTSTIRSVPKHKDEWYLQTEDGEQYGPVTKAEMDSWLEEGRVDATCQLLCDGWEQWKWAEEVYPKLASAFAAPAVEEPVMPTVQLNTAPVKTAAVQTAAVNPFVAPREPATTASAGEGGGAGVTRATRRALADTRPWVMLISLVMFITNGLLALLLLLVMLLSLVTLNVMGLFVQLLYAAFPTMGLFAAYYLFSYAQRIQTYLNREGAHELEAAMLAQKSFWKLSGIMLLVAIGLALIVMILTFLFIGALVAAFSRAK